MVAEMKIANAEQAGAWDGVEGDRWAEHADRYDRAGHRHWERFCEAGLISTGDTVLDIGCGTGRPTRDAARLAAPGSVLGIDLSAHMLEHAREQSQADGLSNVTFVQADGQVHSFDPDAFDIAISSFGAMFFGDPVAAFANIARALRPRGRVALLAWRDLERNEWLMALRAALAVGRTLPMPPPNAPTPFAFADPEWVRSMLGTAGYEDVELVSIDEPMDLGADATDALEFVRTMGIVHGLTQGLTDDERGQAMSALAETLTAHETRDGVLMGSSAWLITGRRR